jgi:glyceraldehyde 3-phosphate dehydrogenase
MQKRKRVAINGFGRIGRLTARIILNSCPELDLVAVNDLTSPDNLAYLFAHDTTYKQLPYEVTTQDNYLIVKKDDLDQKILVFAEKDPALLPWEDLEIDVVLECTGLFLTTDLASKHLQAGAKQVLLSAPAKDDQIATVVLGVNNKKSILQNRIISNASCTTNCVAPALRVLIENLEVQSVIGQTVHAYTASQVLQDGPNKKDFRDGRAAAQNLIPSHTGAAKAVIKVIPELEGKVSLSSLRVPVITGSMVFLSVFVRDKHLTQRMVNDLFEEAANTYLNGILEFSQDELVSSDIVGNPHSTILDSKLTEVVDRHIKLVLWYDNEWGYANRLVDLAKSF